MRPPLPVSPVSPAFGGAVRQRVLRCGVAGLRCWMTQGLPFLGVYVNTPGDAGATTSLIWQAGGRPYKTKDTDVPINFGDAGTKTYTKHLAEAARRGPGRPDQPLERRVVQGPRRRQHRHPGHRRLDARQLHLGRLVRVGRLAGGPAPPVGQGRHGPVSRAGPTATQEVRALDATGSAPLINDALRSLRPTGRLGLVARLHTALPLEPGRWTGAGGSPTPARATRCRGC